MVHFARINIICAIVRTAFCLRGFSSAFVSSSAFNINGTERALKRSSTALFDNMTDSDGSSGLFYFDEVSSTMEKARELLRDNRDKDAFAVVTARQTAGRGTRGRTWMSVPGNLMMTVALKQSKIPVPLTLTPLRTGTLIFPSIKSRVFSDAPVYLKWPNDILIGGKKVCGILIEIENDMVLIGIGCNLVTAPVVAALGSEAGRPSTCLAEHAKSGTCALPDENAPSNGADSCVGTLSDLHKEIASEIFYSLAGWLNTPDSADAVISDFELYMDQTPQKLRGDAINPVGDEVIPVQINRDGTLQVRSSRDGSSKTLVADYLW